MHKQTIAVAVAPSSPGAACTYFGAIANTPDALRKLCKTLSANGETLHFCYEAGPCGYVVQRRLSCWGFLVRCRRAQSDSSQGE